MTLNGAGGAVIKQLSTTPRFDKQFKKLPQEIQRLVPQKLDDLLANPRPSRSAI
ncbi:MAG: type II toxin-antitoxin system RelE family toxin [Gammaproteobacteria bacterium]